MTHLKKHSLGDPDNHNTAATTYTSDGNVLNADYTIVLDGSSSTVTATMPASPDTNRRWNIVCVDSTNTCQIDFNGKNFYDSSDNEQLFKGENLKVQYDGTQYIGA